MAYNLSYIRNRVMDDKLDDTAYDPGVIDRFINDAQRAIFNSYELPFMEKVFNGTLPETATVVSFPDDYQQLQSMVITSPDTRISDLTDNYLDFRQFNARFPLPENNEPGTPTIWTIYGGKLYLNQPTDADYTLTMFYLKTPTLLTAGEDVPELPSEFEEILVLGAYYRVLERNEDFDQAAYVKQGDYATEVEKMLNRLGKRQSGKTKVMAQPQRFGGRSRTNRRS